jgi:flagellar FliL protein
VVWLTYTPDFHPLFALSSTASGSNNESIERPFASTVRSDTDCARSRQLPAVNANVKTSANASAKSGATSPVEAEDVAVVVPMARKKKLLIVLAVCVGLVLIGTVGTVRLLKKRAAAAAEASEDRAVVESTANNTHKEVKTAPPIFMPLEPFTVNLIDRDADRFAQVGITLEIEDAKVSEQIKSYMPAIRNNILMAIAQKTSAELLERDGKLRLAREIQREALRPLGIEIPMLKAGIETSAATSVGPGPASQAFVDAPRLRDRSSNSGTADRPQTQPRSRDPSLALDSGLPVKAVYFSNFIIQ